MTDAVPSLNRPITLAIKPSVESVQPIQLHSVFARAPLIAMPVLRKTCRTEPKTLTRVLPMRTFAEPACPEWLDVRGSG